MYECTSYPDYNLSVNNRGMFIALSVEIQYISNFNLGVYDSRQIRDKLTDKHAVNAAGNILPVCI